MERSKTVDADPSVESAQPAETVATTGEVEETVPSAEAGAADSSVESAEVAATITTDPTVDAGTAHPDESNRQASEEASKTTEAESGTAQASAGATKPHARSVRPSKIAPLYRALRSRRPVEGKIEKLIKGGYEVRLGKVRAFCPHSQIDLQRVEDPEQQVGRSCAFLITQIRRGGADVVVSRRELLQEQREDEAKAVRATLIEGAVMQGRVAGLADFGAFVDLGAGVMGLVHVSELTHARVARVADAVKVGDAVHVKVLKLHAGKKISLSIRQAQPDPWQGVADRFPAGSTHPGTVLRLTDFGAFVELAPGVDALAPASEFPPTRGGWREGLVPGSTGDWLVLAADAGQRRITVTRPVETGAELPTLEVGAIVKGRIQRIESYGVFVWLAPGHVGLIPNALTGAPRGTNMERRFPLADEVEVEVLEVAEAGRRIRLAKRGVAARTDRPRPVRERRRKTAVRKESVAPPTQPGTFGTSLADKLRAALGHPESG